MPSPTPLSPSEQLTSRARTALAVGRPAEAIPLLLQALHKVGSGNEGAVIMERLSYAHEKTGDNEAALLWAERAVASAPQWHWAHLRRADALDAQGRTGEALAEICEARNLSPQTAHIYLKFARLYSCKKDWAQTEKNALHFRTLAPNDADGHYYLAEVALEKAAKERVAGEREKRLEQAETFLRDGLALDPESPYLQRLMGRLRRRQDRHDEAIPYLIGAARGLPDSSHDQAQVWRGLIGLLIELIGNLSLTGWLIQGVGFFLGWGVWAAYGFALLFVGIINVPILLFPQHVLPFRKPFRRLPSHTKATLTQMATQRKKMWHFGDGITGFSLFALIVVNLLPPLLRGLWNAGVWLWHK